jgi:purine-cytosine permease-like protein
MLAPLLGWTAAFSVDVAETVLVWVLYFGFYLGLPFCFALGLAHASVVPSISLRGNSPIAAT